jgi:integrase
VTSRLTFASLWQPQAIVSALSLDEVRAILSSCRGVAFIRRRDEALVRFLIDTAARVSEALDLTVERLEVETELVIRCMILSELFAAHNAHAKRVAGPYTAKDAALS